MMYFGGGFHEAGESSAETIVESGTYLHTTYVMLDRDTTRAVETWLVGDKRCLLVKDIFIHRSYKCERLISDDNI